MKIYTLPVRHQLRWGRGPQGMTLRPYGPYSGPPTVDSSPTVDSNSKQISPAAAASSTPGREQQNCPRSSSASPPPRQPRSGFAAAPSLPASPPPARTPGVSSARSDPERGQIHLLALAGMPLEVSELFSMAPLSRGGHSTQYVAPKNFDLGAGEARLLQENLVTEYGKLATETNSYLDAEAHVANHAGLEVFEVAMDESKQSIRIIRDQIVQLMSAISNLGHLPLPPIEAIDAEVSRILNDSKMSIVANGASTSEKAECSQPADDRDQRKYTLTSKCPVVSAFLSAPRSDKSDKTSGADPKVYGAVSRGAAARARAEAAWDARARTDGMGRRCCFC